MIKYRGSQMIFDTKNNTIKEIEKHMNANYYFIVSSRVGPYTSFYYDGKNWASDIEKAKTYKTLRGACNVIGISTEKAIKSGEIFNSSYAYKIELYFK